MLRFVLGMMFVFSVTCFAKKTPPAQKDTPRCGPKEFYSYGGEECLPITSNIRLRDRCPPGSHAIGVGYIQDRRALACEARNQVDGKEEQMNRRTEGDPTAADEQNKPD